jgi:hypothetical protein
MSNVAVYVENCEYTTDHAQSDFVASSTSFIGNQVSEPYTITFPSFVLGSESAASCGYVDQTLDDTSLPSDWIVTLTYPGDNSI